ncbi:hypothetical protein H9Y04_40695 [Streptomyces sp. TRM66268-LWL]|uniref:Uncharacterized protein n=1 Tax=Streptomyces polyasparticus TaxID=2767826 RepID=A0ABR7STQ2_9ACTN|nr:hypothetical protein [Streptomyces polyasparticus]MBC9718866.1 hypothetical protein [Streptomyces polyasparticus]
MGRHARGAEHLRISSYVLGWRSLFLGWCGVLAGFGGAITNEGLLPKLALIGIGVLGGGLVRVSLIEMKLQQRQRVRR